MPKKKPFRIAVLCGGPSLERGISLNSARSVCDHLQSDSLEILPVYFDYRMNTYLISRSQLYSNTPSDFDFKLRTSAKKLSRNALVRYLKSVDLVFPAIHGPFGEDGRLQTFLEEIDVPFVGSPANACKQAFDKHRATELMLASGFMSLPSLLLTPQDKRPEKKVYEFFRKHKIKRAIVKPATGGSSISVFSVTNVKDAVKKAADIFEQRIDRRVVVEPFCTGIEFTVIILQNRFGMPVAILPTEIEIDYRDNQIFDYRKKYLATRQVTYHCPPRFEDDVIERIQIQAEQFFSFFGMRDFARFDGWLLPDGQLWFSDFNPISGMEQNSFLFIQSSRIGMSHRDLLRYVIKSACRRYGLKLPDEEIEDRQGTKNTSGKTKPVHVLFGGATAERQVSLMTGTNVWLKLRRSKKFSPQPFLLDKNHRVWRLPYAFALNHTVEEVFEMCKSAKGDEERLHRFTVRIVDKLCAAPEELTEQWFLPEEMSLEEFIRRSKYVFIGLHGGIGENGVLQKKLERARVKFNGAGSFASRLCMDKFKTGQVIMGLGRAEILTAKKKKISVSLLKKFHARDYKELWGSLVEELESRTIIVKPLDDGCSAGVARLYSAEDLITYMRYVFAGMAIIPVATLTKQHGIIDMPTQVATTLLFEEFITSDQALVSGNHLHWVSRGGDWIEITMGVLERKGVLRALVPSLTVASGNILSLEEKFQGGTGVNITPPPEKHVSLNIVNKARQSIELVARALGIKDYARIDAFMNRKTGALVIIEANTLPGLTPSTVIYHQALAENPPLYPVEFLEAVVDSSYRRRE